MTKRLKESEIIEIATNTKVMDFLSDYLDISGCGEFIQINDNQNGTYIINGDKKILIDSQVTGIYKIETCNLHYLLSKIHRNYTNPFIIVYENNQLH